jgi:phosphohistidine swiveling domain-containing protein
VTITGVIANLARSGEGGLDTSFRIDDFTIARVAAGTPVIAGSQTGDTNFLREGQTVTVEGRRDNGFLDATRVEIIQQAP